MLRDLGFRSVDLRVWGYRGVWGEGIGGVGLRV